MSDWDISDPLTTLQITGSMLLGGLAMYYLGRLVMGDAAPAPAAPVVAVAGVAAPPPMPPGPPPVPPAIFIPPAVADPGGIAATLLDEYEDIRFNARLRSYEDGKGHILARHGPDLSDAQLQARLTTGLDSKGEPAPTAGVSSKFTSKENIVGTMQEVISECFHKGLKQTTRYLRPALQRVAAAQAALAGAGGGAASSAAAAELRSARDDLRAMIDETNNNRTGAHLMLPVYWSNNNGRIELFEKYCMYWTHPGAIGTGFYGTGPMARQVVNGIPPKGQGKSKPVVKYARTHAYNGPLNQTMTVLKLKQNGRIFGQRLDRREFTFITHYPTGRTAGGDELVDGIADASGTA